MADPFSLLALTATVAAAAGGPCAGESPAVTAYFDGGGLRLAIVPEGSPLLAADGPLEAELQLHPLESGITLLEAAARARDGKLTCGGPIGIQLSAVRGPVDGAPPTAQLPLPALAPAKGHTDAGSEDVELMTRVQDLSTSYKEREAVLPVLAGAPVIVAVEGGAALLVPLSLPLLGPLGRVYGPVVRLNARGAAAPETTRLEPAGTFVGEAARARLALDAREGALVPGQVLSAGVAGYGRIARTVAPPEVELHDAGDPFSRALVAHGIAAGLPLLSIAISQIGLPRCVVMCDSQVLPFDRAYLRNFVTRDADAIRSAESRLYLIEGVAGALALLSALAPSGRRGVLSRLEILEDVLVMGEGVMVSVTTPFFFRNRLGRNRPVAFHPVLEVETRDTKTRIGPPLVAFGANYAGSLLGSATTLLVLEESPWPYVVLTSSLLTAMTVVVSVAEVDAGYAFPSDVPLSVLYGAINGAGVVLWHHVFWRGWPGDDRGDLPLRIEGLRLQFSPEGTIIGLGGAF